MRMQLPVLPRGGTGGNDAQLAPGEVESRARQHLSVAFDEHPGVKQRMELTNVVPQPLVRRAVHDAARGFAIGPPRRELAGIERNAAGDRLEPAPLAHRVEGSWKPREQVSL